MTCLSCCSQTKRRSLLHRLREHLSRSSALTPRALSICSVWCGPLDGPCGPGLACFPTAAPCAGTKALSQNAFLRSLAPRSRETAAGATKIRSNMLVFARAFALAGKFGLVDTAPACLLRCPVRIQSPLERSCGGVGAGPASLWASHDAIVLGRSPNITPIRGRNLTVARRSITARRTARCAVLPLLVIFATENF
jgi:hypothetical protein